MTTPHNSPANSTKAVNSRASGLSDSLGVSKRYPSMTSNTSSIDCFNIGNHADRSLERVGDVAVAFIARPSDRAKPKSTCKSYRHWRGQTLGMSRQTMAGLSAQQLLYFR
jgi:hypothetical protein